jgi:PAS domain S-box-containing protein
MLRDRSAADADNASIRSTPTVRARSPESNSASTLRVGLILLATACTAVAVIVSTAFVLSHARSERSAMDSQARQVAATGAQFFEREIATVQVLLNGLAVSPTLRADDFAGFYNQAISVAKPLGSFILLYDRDRATVDGQNPLINTNLPFGVPTPEQAPETRIAVDEMVRKVVETRQTQISEVVFARVQNADVAGICIPIVRADIVRYVLCAALDATESVRVFDAEFPAAWFAGTFDRDGKLLAANRSPERAANAPVVDAASLEHFREPNGAFDAFTADSRLVHVAYSYVSDTGWISTVAVPVATLNAPIQRAYLTSSAAGASLLLAVACLAFLAAPHITRPLRKRITEGDTRFHEMANTVPSILYTADVDGRCDYISDRFYEYTGRSPGTALDRGWLSSLHPDDRERVLSRLPKNDGKEELSFVHEVRLKSAEGNYRWFALRHRLLPDVSGRPPTWFGTATDIDDLKRAEIDHHRLSRLLLKTQDDARRQIARELHDTTTQNLVAANLQLGLLSATSVSANTIAAIAGAQELIIQSLEELRTLAYLLHPPVLDQLGLTSAIRWYVRGFEQRSGMDVVFTSLGDTTGFPADIEHALYRVVQEGLTNVHRHADSSKASVTLTSDDGSVSLEIIDEGKGLPGFSVDRAPSDEVSLGVGIPGMRLRLEEFGGSLEIKSGPRGTALRATVPLRPINSARMEKYARTEISESD